MQCKKLGEICTIQSGGTPPRSKSDYWKGGNIPWVKISDIKQKYVTSTEEYITELGLENSSAKVFEAGTILFTIFATLGEVAILDIQATTNQAIAGLSLTDNAVEKEYLYYFLTSIKDKVNDIGRGVAQNNINMTILKNLDIPVPSHDVQMNIVVTLNKLEELISDANLQLAKLDELVKAKFVEMFGDPEINDKNLPCKKMPDLCNIIDGDRGKNYPSQDDFCDKGYCLFLNAKNVTSQGFDFSHCMFISEERDNLLRKGKLLLGDVVLTTRGTIGNLANYTEDVPFENIRINSGMVILRFSHNVNKVFFITQFRMLLKQIKNSIVSGTAQPQLPISTMNKIKLIVPAIAKQNQFADYVCKVDGIKDSVRKKLDNLETLKKSLMQEYFG